MKKITANVARDVDTTRRLEELGWRVVRIWEHEPVDTALRLVEDALAERRTEVISNAG